MKIEQLVEELNKLAEAQLDDNFDAIAHEDHLQILTTYEEEPRFFKFTPAFLDEYQEVVGRFQVVLDLYETSFLQNWVTDENDYVEGAYL